MKFSKKVSQKPISGSVFCPFISIGPFVFPSAVFATGGQIVIFGKIGHPEVLGLVGQVEGGVTVVENPEQLRARLEDGVPAGV